MPGKYHPRQPRRTHRFSKRMDTKLPQRLPPGIKLAPRTKAAVAIQRNFRKNRQIKYNKEIKSMEAPGQTYTLSKQAKSSSQMENGLVLYPAPFHADHYKFSQAVGANAAVIGTWLTPQYLTQKFVVDWASLTHHEDLNKGLELRCRYGYIKCTAHKANISLDANWQSNVNVLVCRELQNSGIDDNFLTFTKTSRTVHMLGDFMVRPNLNQRPAVYQHDNVTTAEARFAPPTNLTIRWSNKKMFSKDKRRLAKIDSATDYVLHHNFIPFVYFSCDNITTNMGDLTIAQSSKFYYEDS